MHLVQLFLPLRDNAGEKFPGSVFRRIRSELTESFGGMTAYARVPAEGHWQSDHTVVRDELVVYEVMVDTLDRSWWAQYRASLEQLLAQEQLLIRAQRIDQL